MTLYIMIIHHISIDWVFLTKNRGLTWYHRANHLVFFSVNRWIHGCCEPHPDRSGKKQSAKRERLAEKVAPTYVFFSVLRSSLTGDWTDWTWYFRRIVIACYCLIQLVFILGNLSSQVDVKWLDVTCVMEWSWKPVVRTWRKNISNWVGSTKFTETPEKDRTSSVFSSHSSNDLMVKKWGYSHFSDIPWHILVGGLEHFLFFHIIIGNNNPSWLIFFRGVGIPQPDDTSIFLHEFWGSPTHWSKSCLGGSSHKICPSWKGLSCHVGCKLIQDDTLVGGSEDLD
jgi:hypothetical protein